MSDVPELRLRKLNDRPARPDGDYVLYWMVAARRTRFNFALERAVELAREQRKPLVVLEALRCDYPWASPRFHRFVIDGMADNRTRLERAGATYLPYVEPEPGAGKGLLAALAQSACSVVTDDFPCFMIPKMIAAGARQVDVRTEAVDANGLLPLRAADRAFPTAYAFRRFLQRELRPHLAAFPEPDPLKGCKLPPLAALPEAIAKRWPAATDALLRAGGTDWKPPRGMSDAVAPTGQRGGPVAAEDALRTFVDERLDSYDEDRNQPDTDATSELSPYLHFGHVSAHQVAVEIFTREDWSIDSLADTTDGSRSGWWGTGSSAEAFLDQLVTWRELGYNGCAHMEQDYASFDSLPDWAVATLEEHASDPREHVYSLEEFEGAETHDKLWNAAQRQLVEQGRIHNYLRMLWGKKILEWTAHPREALDVMIELNNKYALDGRNPNSYSGIFWVLGRYDRAWGPERPIYGKVRYMTSQNTARKYDVKPYLQRWSGQRSPLDA